MIIEFDWLQQDGVKKVLSLLYSIIGIIRFVIPIILILMTTIEIAKKVINPKEENGQKKILTRIIAAIIIFFIPTFIDLFAYITGIEVVNLKKEINNSSTVKDNTTKANTTKNNTVKNNPVKKEVILSDLSVSNCPNSLKKYHNGDSITLNTNIPSTYNGDIIWSVLEGMKYIKYSPTNNNKSINIKISGVNYSDKVVLEVSSKGKKGRCTIYVDKEKINNLSYTNCPIKTKYYYVGDSIELKTDINSNYHGEIVWYIDNNEAASIKTSNDKKEAKVDILDHTKEGYVIVSTVAGGKASACIINIAVVKELLITNCPPKGNVYHVGDTIVLNSNLPNYYKGSINWNNSTYSPDTFMITPSKDGRSATLKIVKVPQENYGYVGLGADRKGTSCSIYIES